ncbi:hypothetical protein AVEN_2438-1 [Araneus ventricosus]|uniref:Uncharacterized protein n=1 Tax=Araneus ventricosus TaxID=182803 RepID=A0A4Y2IME7_ARAVE|nr:hypothetical protein AVEN_2438-1 [Araneus ventricosus]
MDLVILNCSQMMMTTPELAPLSASFRTTSAINVQFNVWPIVPIPFPGRGRLAMREMWTCALCIAHDGLNIIKLVGFPHWERLIVLAFMVWL